jgi:hypothetical protein
MGAGAVAQNLNISGAVLDGSGSPVVGASVVVKGTTVGTSTNASGEYSIAAPANATLVYSFLGMTPKEEAVSGRGRIDVVMGGKGRKERKVESRSASPAAPTASSYQGGTAGFTAKEQKQMRLKLDNKRMETRMGQYGIDMMSYFIFAVKVNYTTANFLNPTFFNSMNRDKIVSRKGGFNIGAAGQLWLFQLEASLFYTYYNVNNDEYKAFYFSDPKNIEPKTQVRGGDIYASFCPMPNFGLFSRVVEPYIGIGYQTASLRASVDIPNGKQSSSSGGGGYDLSQPMGSISLNQPMWRCGLYLNAPLFSLCLDYKQSFDLSSRVAMNFLSVGIAMRVGGY